MVLERWRPRWGLRTWRPSRDIEDLERQFDEVFAWPPATFSWRRGSAERGWIPPVEMYEKDDNYVVRAELPGMKKEDIEIHMVGDTLTLKGERKVEHEVKEEDYYHSERCYGSFMRSIGLPSAVDANEIEAEFTDGVLEINLPKAAELKPRKVEIKAK